MSGVVDSNSVSVENNKVMEETTNSFLYVLEQIRKRNLDFLSFQALKIRVLVDWILPFLNMKLEDVYALKDKFYIHPQCSLAINKLFSSLKLSPLDKILIQNLMSQDYHDFEIVEEFGKMVTRLLAGEDCPELKKKKNELDKIFAIDIWRGDVTKYEKYIYNLKYPFKAVGNEDYDFIMKHICAVRQLYDEYDKTVTPAQVYRALMVAFGKNNEDDRDEINQLAEFYIKLLEEQKDLIMEKMLLYRLAEEL